MARLAWIALIALPLWASCGSTSGDKDKFAEANSLMADEIRNRIAQIPYQHREELFNNLLWLAQAGEQAIPELLVGLSSPNAKLRSNCCWVLGRIADRRVIPNLQKLVRDSNQTVSLEAARTLVLLGDIEHCAPLIAALDSDQVQVRYLCHEALKTATGQDFGYDHLTDNADQRHTTVLAWRKWWSKMSGDPWFAQSYAREHGLTGEPAAPAPGGTTGDFPSPAPMSETAPGKTGTTDPLRTPPLETGVETLEPEIGPESWQTPPSTTKPPATGGNGR